MHFRIWQIYSSKKLRVREKKEAIFLRGFNCLLGRNYLFAQMQIVDSTKIELKAFLSLFSSESVQLGSPASYIFIFFSTSTFFQFFNKSEWGSILLVTNYFSQNQIRECVSRRNDGLRKSSIPKRFNDTSGILIATFLG